MTGIIKVDTIQNNGGTTGLTIDSAGYITSGKVPAWRIGRDTDFNVTASGTYTKVEWDERDNSSVNTFMDHVTYSSGDIVIPVAGIYQFNATVRFDQANADSGYGILSLQKNDERSGLADTYLVFESQSNSYHSVSASTVFKCNANDTLAVYVYHNNDSSFHISNGTSSCSGVRIG